MMKLLITLIPLLLLGASFKEPDCSCLPAKPDETTYEHGNIFEVFIEKEIYKSLRGVVRSYGQTPLANVLVEVYDRPDYLLLNTPGSPQEDKRQRRVATCKTGVGGRFCFKGLRAGKYELRTSSDDPALWNVSHVYIVINPRSRRSINAEVNVKMTVAN